MFKKVRNKVGKKRWLKNFVTDSEAFDVYKYLDRVRAVKIGRQFTKKEMNAR